MSGKKIRLPTTKRKFLGLKDRSQKMKYDVYLVIVGVVIHECGTSHQQQRNYCRLS